MRLPPELAPQLVHTTARQLLGKESNRNELHWGEIAGFSVLGFLLLMLCCLLSYSAFCRRQRAAAGESTELELVAAGTPPDEIASRAGDLELGHVADGTPQGVNERLASRALTSYAQLCADQQRTRRGSDDSQSNEFLASDESGDEHEPPVALATVLTTPVNTPPPGCTR